MKPNVTAAANTPKKVPAVFVIRSVADVVLSIVKSCRISTKILSSDPNKVAIIMRIHVRRVIDKKPRIPKGRNNRIFCTISGIDALLPSGSINGIQLILK